MDATAAAQIQALEESMRALREQHRREIQEERRKVKQLELERAQVPRVLMTACDPDKTTHLVEAVSATRPSGTPSLPKARQGRDGCDSSSSFAFPHAAQHAALPGCFRSSLRRIAAPPAAGPRSASATPEAR